jgi:four helix bundle protein
VSGEQRAVMERNLLWMKNAMSIQSYRDLKVWQNGMNLAEQAYQLTHTFPKEELFGLTSQIRRAAASIPANIAEGWGRQTTGEFRQFLHNAQGSLRELETHFLLALRLNIASKEQIRPLLEACQVLGRQLINLQRSLTARKRS